jgi:hypothetical protein
MKCLEFQQQISDFLDNRLSTTQVEQFIEHADSCPECMEELELRYMIQVGILGQDSDDVGQSYDYRQRLNHMMERTRNAVRSRRVCQIIKYVVSTMVFWASVAVTVVMLRVWIIG